jgi:hypothetical protein
MVTVKDGGHFLPLDRPTQSQALLAFQLGKKERREAAKEMTSHRIASALDRERPPGG